MKQRYTLGAAPDNLTVNVTKGYDFVSGLSITGTTFSMYSTVKLVFTRRGAEWVAQISSDGSSAEWEVDKDVVADAVNGESVDLVYIEGNTERCLARGTVVVE